MDTDQKMIELRTIHGRELLLDPALISSMERVNYTHGPWTLIVRSDRREHGVVENIDEIKRKIREMTNRKSKDDPNQ